MESVQEQIGRARAEQEKLAAEKAYYGTLNEAAQPSSQVGGIGAQIKQMSSRERLLDLVRNHKETYIRKLVTLQRAEDKINSLRLSEAEAVQDFLDLLAQSGI